MGIFEIKDKFYLNGEPFQIISGAMHYFRVPREYWGDRLAKLRAMGCNTVETYVPWNLHEPQRGEFCFEGNLDISAFIREAEAAGLYVIVRPSPFICAEWEFGGLPFWLLSGEDIPIRSSKGPFLSYVSEYYRRLFPEFVELQITRGGPIIMMQVENEFGAWGDDDQPYLQAMAQLMRECGAEVPFITSDNLGHNSFDRGPTDGALATVNFGSDAPTKLELLRPYAKGGPLMVTEFWVGWFDAWGDEAHHTAPAEKNAADLDYILKNGASVNFYMFHGGTNPGFMNGANYYEHITPDVTSYDYDAPLSEDGAITPKYLAFREVIGRYADLPALSENKIKKIAYGAAKPCGAAPLFGALDRMVSHKLDTPKSMERLGRGYGYLLYSANIEGKTSSKTIEFTKCADRAQIFLNGEPTLTLYDRETLGEIKFEREFPDGSRIDILVENLGRVNYGKNMLTQRKGIDGDVLIDGKPIKGWTVYDPALDVGLPELAWSEKSPASAPAFFRFTFNVDELGDTYLDTSGWEKGCAFVGGVNIGRFWSVGPQKRLYIPAPLLHKGENEVVIFETEGVRSETVVLRDEGDLG